MKNASRIIGSKVPRVDGVEKVTGVFKYTTDLELSDLHHAAVLRSNHPHAVIKKIEVTEALAIEGVIAVYTAKDVSEKLFGEVIKDTPLFAQKKVRYHGEPVAAVIAESDELARAALKAIKVEYQLLEYVLDPVAAMKDQAPLIHENFPENIAVKKEVVRGNVTQAFSECAAIEKDTFHLPLVYQAPLETNACITYLDSKGQLNLLTPNQSPSWLRSRIADHFDLPLQKVRVVQIQGGGGFGGKVPLSIEPICCALTLLSKKAVRLVNNREEDFYATYCRVGMKIDLELGVDAKGNLLAKRTQVVADNGAYSNIAPGVLSTVMTRIDSLYRLKNVHNVGCLVYTNKIPTGMFRGFGNPQITFAFETLIDRLAKKLDMDPAMLRSRNASCCGDVTVHGWEISSSGLMDCIDKAVKNTNWAQRNSFQNLVVKDKNIFRGIGMACCIHVAGNRGVYPSFDGSAAEVRISADGTVLVLSGEGEIGCGTNTTFAQIAAEVLGVEMDCVCVPEVDTQYSPFGLGAYASRVTVIGGNAVKAAAEDALRQLKNAASKIMKANIEKIEIQKGYFEAEGQKIPFAQICQEACFSDGGTVIVGKGKFVPSNVCIADKETLYGNISPSYSFGAQVAEVEVDIDTGRVEIVDYLAIQDLGKVLNPLGAEGQLEGGVVQGIGYTFYEKMLFDEQGQLINPRFRDYKLPTIMDIPPIRVDFVEPIDPVGPFGAKSVAEPALVPTAPAICNAIYNAVGISINSLPLTFEDLRKKIKEKMEKNNF